MDIIADLHIHGKYSRGCSKNINLLNLEKWGRIKGLNLIGTGDFTHEAWLDHLKKNLTEEEGILKTKTGYNFLLQTEISLIYTQDGKGRKVHQIVLAPNFEVVDQIRDELLKRGRLDYDGRPIFKIPSPDFVEMLRNISKDIEVIPAHVLTPHFSIFGEYTNFSNVKECFLDQTKHVHALETGLSADPEMLNRMSQLDKYLFVSFSDSHSFWPWRIGREATLFNSKMTYKDILNVLRTKKGFLKTIEVDPNYGKYHFDGHRKCETCLHPKISLKLDNKCPKCNKKITVGVMQRVEKLADRPEGFKLKNSQDYLKLMPLSDLISTAMGYSVNTKKVWSIFNKLILDFDSEFNVLLNVPYEKLSKSVPEKIAQLIIKNRKQELKVKPGYDGVYGSLFFD